MTRLLTGSSGVYSTTDLLNPVSFEMGLPEHPTAVLSAKHLGKFQLFVGILVILWDLTSWPHVSNEPWTPITLSPMH